MHKEYCVHYEIYDSALNFLNEKMIASNKSRIKSINDEYKEGDLVLVKDGSNYHVGLYNGVYIQIIKSNVDIPKSQIELDLDKERENVKRKFKN
jgi:hypothetical protein